METRKECWNVYISPGVRDYGERIEVMLKGAISDYEVPFNLYAGLGARTRSTGMSWRFQTPINGTTSADCSAQLEAKAFCVRKTIIYLHI